MVGDQVIGTIETLKATWAHKRVYDRCCVSIGITVGEGGAGDRAIQDHFAVACSGGLVSVGWFSVRKTSKSSSISSKLFVSITVIIDSSNNNTVATAQCVTKQRPAITPDTA